MPLILFWICWGAAPAGEFHPDLVRLANYLEGSFSSAAQAAEDEDFFDIRLEVIRIWPDRKDAIWLYVEQAAASNLERPYRQRVYQLLRHEDGKLESRIYAIQEPLRFAGARGNPQRLAALTEKAITERKGCAVFLKSMGDGSFAGETGKKSCHSELRGASYATSEVVLKQDHMVSWDQGWDAQGKQVWGATKGGYVFRRQ